MWKVAPAVAYGNTVVVKPSEYSSLTVLKLREILQNQPIYDKGVIQILIGDKIVG